MVDRSGTIPELDPTSIPGPETVSRRELKNGIILLARENFSSPSVVISGYIPSGSLVDPQKKAGLADLAISALMRGTKSRSFQEIYESIESIGASLQIGASKHSISFFAKSLAEDLETLLTLIDDILRNPSFPEKQVGRLKAEKLTSLAIREQKTGARANLAFHELAYRDHPYRLSTDGYLDTVADLTVEDLRTYHKTHVGPEGMVVSIVGGVESGKAMDAVEASLGDWKNSNFTPLPDLPELKKIEGLLRKEIFLEGKTQSDIVLGLPGPSRFEPDYLAAALGNNILGRFGLYGRIGDSVRDNAGLAYYAYSSLAGGPGPGSWRVIAGVNPANVEKAIDLIREEIRKIVTEEVTEEELTDNQANFIGGLPLQLESNEGVAGALVHVERYQLGLNYYQRYPELIRSITREQILETGKRYLNPYQLAIAVAGPKLMEG
jgi:zinc protease